MASGWLARHTRSTEIALMEQLLSNYGGVEQVIGREGETATLLSRCPLNFGGLGGVFAPRHLSHCASFLLVA